MTTLQLVGLALCMGLTALPLVILWVCSGTDEGDEVRWGFRDE